MPLGRGEAERSLSLLWEFVRETEDPELRSAYGKAISSLHSYLTDVLPACQPSLLAKGKDGPVEIHPKEDAPIRIVELLGGKEERLGLGLDSVSAANSNSSEGSYGGISPIVISQVKSGGIAARNGSLNRGDQLLEINGHSLAHVSLERARCVLIGVWYHPLLCQFVYFFRTDLIAAYSSVFEFSPMSPSCISFFFDIHYSKARLLSQY